MALLLEDTHAGWTFNSQRTDKIKVGKKPPYHYYKTPMSPDQAAGLPEQMLRQKPFYEPFKYQELYQAGRGSDVAHQKIVQYDLLATAIPAMTYAVAANSVEGFAVEDDANIDMMSLKNNDLWPREDAMWRHSDFRNVALSYVWPVFEVMIKKED